MRSEIGYDEFKLMMAGAIQIIKDNHEYLSRLDTAIGDGDHGVSMLRAFKQVEAVIAKDTQKDLKTLVNDIAWSLLGCDGGSTGPLMGSLFLGIADGISSVPLDGLALAAAFESGLACVGQQTKAKVGDKTMMDALIPAVMAIRQAAEAGKPVEEIIQAAIEAARAGAESTKDLQARYGRARNLGERTIGHQDPGANSIALIFQGFRQGLEETL